jgi:septum formation topological specificity factor MinE
MKATGRILTAAVLAALSVLPAGSANARQPHHQQAQAPKTRLELLLARERNTYPAYPAPDHQQAQAPKTRLELLLARERNSYPAPDTPIPAHQQPQTRPDRPLPLLAAQRKALYQSERERTLARHRALGAIADQPVTRTDPAAPSPGVDVLATLLVGLVGGLIGGAAAMLGWTATTRRRRPRAVAGTSSH